MWPSSPRSTSVFLLQYSLASSFQEESHSKLGKRLQKKLDDIAFLLRQSAHAVERAVKAGAPFENSAPQKALFAHLRAARVCHAFVRFQSDVSAPGLGDPQKHSKGPGNDSSKGFK